MTFLKMAWLNVWRNKRRTLITVASIGFAVVLATVMRGLVEGAYSNMIQNVAGFSTGFLQVHQKGYWKERNIDHVMVADTGLMRRIASVKHVTFAAPRIETPALASVGQQTSVVMLMAIDPVLEDNMTHLAQKMHNGRYLQPNDESILVGAGLASRFNIAVGDTLVIMTQGYHATSANGLYPVCGIVELGSPELNKSTVYLPVQAAQRLLSLEQQLTGIALMIGNPRQMQEAKEGLQQTIDTSLLEVMDWKEMMPELDQMIEADRSGHRITIAVLYLVIGFGVFSTVLMMMMERQREFGIMVAIGLKKPLLARMLLLETLLILLLGLLSGTLAAWPVMQYLYHNPIQFSGELKEVYESYGFEAILPVSTDMVVFWSQIKAVAYIGALVMTYPLIHIARFQLMKALRS